MFILELEEDYGYDDYQKTNLVVSNDRDKLELLAKKLKSDLIEMYNKSSAFTEYLNKKYKPNRYYNIVKERMQEEENLEKELKSNYEDVIKYELYDLHRNMTHCGKYISFSVEEIDYI